jgi:hypothetical protein
MNGKMAPVASRRSLSGFRTCACTEAPSDEVGSSQTISDGQVAVPRQRP